MLTLSPRPLTTSTTMGHPQLQTALPACAWTNATSTLWSWRHLPWNGGLLPGDKTEGSYTDYILPWRNRVSSFAINLLRCLFSIYLMLLSLLFVWDNYRPPENNLLFQLHRMSPVLRSHTWRTSTLMSLGNHLCRNQSLTSHLLQQVEPPRLHPCTKSIFYLPWVWLQPW